MSQYTEIPFSGINNTNPDTLNDNGEVAAAFGLTSNGAVAAAAVPTATHLYNLPDNAKPLLIHSGSGYKNIFVYLPAAEDTDTDFKGRTVAYEYSELLADKGKDADGNIIAPAELCAESGRPTSTTTIGNIAVLSFSDKLRYAYRTADGYALRPCKIPPLQLEIIAACRKAYYNMNEEDKTSYTNPDFPDNIHVRWEAGNSTGITYDNIKVMPKQFDSAALGAPWATYETVMGYFTEMIGFWGGLGYLFSPVLVRAAYRLKTGELAGLTNPVLCFPFDKPMIAGKCFFSSDDGRSDDGIQIMGVAYKLFAKFKQCAEYEEWKDLISSIEIYTTPPIYTHSVDYKKMYWYETANSEQYQGFDLFGQRADHSGFIVVPRETGGLTKENLIKQSNFFLARSIPFDNDISRTAASWKEHVVDETSDIAVYQREIFELHHVGGTASAKAAGLFGYRKLIDSTEPGTDISMTSESISARSPLADQLRSNMPFTTGEVTAYNSRLVISGSEYDLTAAAEAQSYFAGCVSLFKEGAKNYTDNLRHDHFATVPATPVDFSFLTLASAGIAEIKDRNMGEHKYCEFPFPVISGVSSLPKFITCEEPHAVSVKCVALADEDYYDARSNIKYAAGEHYVLTLTFREHPNLSLSYFTGEVSAAAYSVTDPDTKEERLSAAAAAYQALEAKLSDPANRRIGRSDYIRESDAADPYSFQSSNTAYLNSRVNRVLIVPEQISLGQYGQSQMYAVCDDGVYTVKVDDEGKLLFANTYTQDIIDHPERACVAAGQLTSNNTAAWDAYSQQQRTRLLDLARNLAFHFHRYPLISAPPAWAHWKTLLQDDKVYDFFRNAVLRYDGRNNQLVAFRAGSGCIAALNADLGLTLLDCPAEYEVNAPWLVLADNDRNIYEFPDADPETASGKALIITRPIHLGSSRDALVTVRKAHVRGVFRKDCVHTALYGTRDYIHWHLVASSKTERIDAVSGSGYKAFAVAVYADLKGGEHLTHISLEHEEKRNARTPY